ncbi:MAG TPA: hypothetical protein VMD74_01960 [Candidatus Methylomirabilis sp.]|nr:hypothetical protein [Candidatus Methylomirabilis sp.]
MNILIGLIIAVVGALITIKSEAIYNMFGRIEFFEKYLGTEGGSRLGYKLLGILAFLIGVMIATNVIGDFMYWLLSPLINAGRGGM